MIQWRRLLLTSWMISLWISCTVWLLKITGSNGCRFTLKVPRNVFAMEWNKVSNNWSQSEVTRRWLHVIQMLLVVYQRGLTSGAGASILQVKAQWTFAAERASCVHTPGAHGAGAAHTLIHVWTFIKWFYLKGLCWIHTHIFGCWIWLKPFKEEQKLTLAAGGSGPTLLAVAGERMAFIADTHPSVHTRVRSAGVSWSRRAEILP